MDSLTSIGFFVQVAETRSFSEASRLLGVSPSAVGKSVSRLEAQLGVRLFHRSTRSVTLTAEGALFLERSRRILSEVEAAQLELSTTRRAPQGRLRLSAPLVGSLVMPMLNRFMKRYPEIELDVDFSNRLVDIIDEGFDAVIRTGEPADSRLMSRPIGAFRLMLVAAPTYLAERGTPGTPRDLLQHACLHHRLPSTGRREAWPLDWQDADLEAQLPAAMTSNTIEPLYDAALAGCGIACLPDFMVRDALRNKTLAAVLEPYVVHHGTFRVLWPSSRHLAPKLRVFIDFAGQELFGAKG